MRLSNMIVREASENEFVIGILLSSSSSESVEASFANSSLRTVPVELLTETGQESDVGLRIRIRCLLPN